MQQLGLARRDPALGLILKASWTTVAASIRDRAPLFE
jgi:hypothetical protein